MCGACRARRAATPHPRAAVLGAPPRDAAAADDDDIHDAYFDVVVCGAGAAGTSFARTYLEATTPSPSSSPSRARLLLLDRGGCAKTVERVERATTRAHACVAREGSMTALRAMGARTTTASAKTCDAKAKTLTLRDGRRVRYGALCVATGASARCPMPEAADGAADVHEVRDVESADALARRLRTLAATTGRGEGGRARRVAIAGNGGIALELVDALCGRGARARGLEACELVWLVKHGEVGDAFFDVDAADFLLRAFEARRRDGEANDDDGADADRRSTTDERGAEPSRKKRARERESGAAAGPDWLERFRAKSAADDARAPLSRMKLRVLKNVRIVEARKDADTGVNVLTLSDGTTIEVDVVVAAAGVEPRCDWLDEVAAPRSKSDGGILVDACMRTVGPYGDSIFAVGDACTMAARASNPETTWFQMRLWSQAAQTGAFAAKVAAGVCDADALGFNFEIFTHVTRFFGLKVILLGLYNAQKLDDVPASEITTYQRESLADATYARVLLVRGRMMGAVLVGDTDLEETFENLILDGVDLSRFGPSLLDPELDLEDYFD